MQYLARIYLSYASSVDPDHQAPAGSCLSDQFLYSLLLSHKPYVCPKLQVHENELIAYKIPIIEELDIVNLN